MTFIVLVDLAWTSDIIWISDPVVTQFEVVT